MFGFKRWQSIDKFIIASDSVLTQKSGACTFCRICFDPNSFFGIFNIHCLKYQKGGALLTKEICSTDSVIAQKSGACTFCQDCFDLKLFFLISKSHSFGYSYKMHWDSMLKENSSLQILF